MNPRDIQEQAGLFPAIPPAPRALLDIAALQAQAAAARDAALAETLGGFFRSIRNGAFALATAIRTWPERRAAYERLRTLSDRELADIGLARGDIARVFDPGFNVPGQAANANLPASRAA
jgi:uncharacterized protein YjiS (DUF1127 family)